MGPQPITKKGAWSGSFGSSAILFGAARTFTTLEECNRQALKWRAAPSRRLLGNTPHASSVAFLLRQSNLAPLLPLDLGRHPKAQNVEDRPHDLETYDELAHRRDDEPER